MSKWSSRGPFVVDLLTHTADSLDTQLVQPGDYRSVKGHIAPLKTDDWNANDFTFLVGSTVFIQGTVTGDGGGAFTYQATIRHPFKIKGNFTVETATPATAFLVFDTTQWLCSSHGTFLDPRDPANDFAIRRAIIRSLKIGMDDNHDGRCNDRMHGSSRTFDGARGSRVGQRRVATSGSALCLFRFAGSSRRLAGEFDGTRHREPTDARHRRAAILPFTTHTFTADRHRRPARWAHRPLFRTVRTSPPPSSLPPSPPCSRLAPPRLTLRSKSTKSSPTPSARTTASSGSSSTTPARRPSTSPAGAFTTPPRSTATQRPRGVCFPRTSSAVTCSISAIDPAR